MEEKYSASAVANYFIKRALDEDVRDLTQMKLQKLVYLAYGWCLSYADIDIIGGEQAEAWKHGPVIASLYHSTKHYKNAPIDQLIEGMFGEITEEGEMLSPVPEKIPTSDLKVVEVLDAIWEKYKGMTAAQLRKITHEQDTPWKMVFDPQSWSEEIPRKFVKAYYDLLSEKA